MTPRRRSPSGQRRDHTVDFAKAPAGPCAVHAGGFRRGAGLAGRPTPPGRLDARSPGPNARSCGPSTRVHPARRTPADHSGPIAQNQLAYQ